MPQMHWLDRLSLAMARGTSRKDFLKLAGATVAGLVAGDAAVVEAKKSKGPTCATGLTACAAAPPSDDGPTAAKKSKGPAPVCRDLTSDVNNCGACGAKCATGQTCSASKCQAASGCPTGQTSCSGTCRNLLTDNANCGTCGTACTGGKACQNGSCVTSSCPSGQKLCGTVCQQCCTSADCSGGATCTNGTCTGGSCPIVVSGPARASGRAEPGDPPLTAQFTAMSTFSGQQLKLEVSAIDDRNGGLTLHKLFSLGGASLLQVDSHPAGGGTELTFDYGNAIGGIDKGTCTFDGSLIRCVIDGRKTLPFPPGTDLSKIPFEDGKPPPTPTGDPALQAIDAITNQAKQDLAGCSPSTRPGRPEPANRQDACKQCEDTCTRDAVKCYSTVGAGLGFVGALACDAKGIECLKDCTDPGSACCPQGCPQGCCEKEDRCVQPSPDILRTQVCCPPGRDLCRNSTLCCEFEQVCLDGTVCCPKGVVACKGRCCKAGEVCTPDGACCPPGLAGCRGVCCRSDQGCTTEGFCCPTGTVSCGFTENVDSGFPEPICCKQGEACRQVGSAKVCCGANNTICGGRCCDSTAPCLGGTCCDAPNHACGGACCAPFSTCCNGVCCPESCAGGKVCCKAVNICGSSCCADGQVCCSGTCCAAGLACVGGTCQKVCGANDVPCRALPGNPPCCPSGQECCPNVGCCGAGLQCCNNGFNNSCRANCLA